MQQIYRFDRIEVRPTERAVVIDGSSADLGSRAFDVLLALIRQRDRVVTKDELLDTVWPGLVVEENNLQAQVSALRKILGQKAIATIPGRGYQFTLAETPAQEDASAGIAPLEKSLSLAVERSGALAASATHGALVATPVVAPTLTQAERAAVLGGHAPLALADIVSPANSPSPLIADVRRARKPS